MNMRGTIFWAPRLVAWLSLPLVLAACSGESRDDEQTFDPSMGGTGGGATGGLGATGGQGATGGAGATGGSGLTGGANDADGGANGNTGGNPADSCGDGTEALAPGLRISQVALYQTVKIPLYENGTWVASRVAPVVEGKQALLRVFVEPQAGWSSHTVRAVLTLDNGTPKQLTADLAPTGASSDGQLSSSFNFDLEGADLGANTKLSVAIVEMSCPSTLGLASDVRVPASGTQSLTPQRVGKLRITLVPVALPSGLAPDTGPAQLEDFRQAMLAYYPVADVEFTVHAPYTWSNGINARQGWGELLNAIGQLRQSDQPASDVYYYGLVVPANSLLQYCQGGCTLGIANQPGQPFPRAQVGLGVGFIDSKAYDTMIHEVGHTHGLGHAPCVEGFGQISGVDRGYPNTTGETGTWGWDLREGAIKEPTAKDIMGYCEGPWISAYNYNNLVDRSSQVNQRATLRPAADERVFHTLIVFGDGTARWGGTTTGADLSGAETEQAYALDASGAHVEELDVVRVGLSDTEDAFVYVPDLDSSWQGLEVHGRTIRFADVAPELTP